MRKLKLTRLLLPIPLWFLGGCESWIRDLVHEQMGSADNKIAVTSLSVRKIASRLDQLEGHLSYCSDEVKKLLNKVQSECQAKEVCTPNDANIQVEVLRIDPSKQGRFLSLFQERKHLAFYFPDKLRELTAVEKKSLRDLVKPTWLDDADRHTRFLVVSNIEDGSTGSLSRAEARSWRVINTIAEISRDMEVPSETPTAPKQEAGSEPLKSAAAPRPASSVLFATNGPTILPKERSGGFTPAEAPAPASKAIVHKGRVLNWIFPFSVPGEILRPEDRASKPDEKLARSVWVYRVDC